MIEEIWKDIKEYEGKYQVSNLGNVRSLNYNNTGKPRELKIKVNRLGFCEVKLSKNNKTKDFMVARLVAEAFIPNSKRCEKVINIDGDRLNCCQDNLKWVFNSEQRHLMYNRGNRKTGHPSGNLISFEKKGYKTYSEMARDYGITGKELHKRLIRGWTLKEALKIPVDIKNRGEKPYFYEYYGELLSSDEICRRNHISKKLFNKRIGRGWNVYEASQLPKGVKNEI